MSLYGTGIRKERKRMKTSLVNTGLSRYGAGGGQ